MPTNEYALPPAILPGGPTVGDTQLSISAWGQLIFQARGLTQTLEVIQAAQQQERDAYGELLDLSNPAFRKYQSRIACTDVRPPPFDALWPGMVVEMSCAAFLCYAIGNPGSPAQEEVSGSSFTANGFVFYRPFFPQMMVRSISWQREEWKMNQGWAFSVEQV
jgi:hypothetical protein